MQDWSLHSDATGGYFQCNRFVEQQGNNNNNNTNNSASGNNSLDANGMPWSEDRGNAHAETLRMRERNRKIARFIHHFTRYKAHGDSVLMESRMHSETARRIGDGLQRCKDGKLRWLQGTVVKNPLLDTLKQENQDTDEKIGGDLTETSLLKYVIKNESCLEFLDDGFEELRKCRNVSDTNIIISIIINY